MSIWFATPSLEQIQHNNQNTMVSHLGIEFLEIGDDYVRGRMPVDARTVQPYRILHGGASVVLAETLGSVAASLRLDPQRKYCVGLEINANHIRAVPEGSGYVYGTARPYHIGGSTHVWEIRLEDEKGRLTCISRLTMAILDRPKS